MLELSLIRSTNALRLSPGDISDGKEQEERVRLPGTLDVAAGGRLLGLEVRLAEDLLPAHRALRGWLDDPHTAPFVSVLDDGTAYIELTSGHDDQMRSADVMLAASVREGAIVAIDIPRRGEGYEISYPSGNR